MVGTIYAGAWDQPAPLESRIYRVKFLKIAKISFFLLVPPLQEKIVPLPLHICCYVVYEIFGDMRVLDIEYPWRYDSLSFEFIVLSDSKKNCSLNPKKPFANPNSHWLSCIKISFFSFFSRVVKALDQNYESFVKASKIILYCKIYGGC